MKMIKHMFPAVLLLAACNQNKAVESKPTRKTPDQMITEHLSKYKEPKPTFLGFRFGASKKEVEKHIQSLISTGKLENLSNVTFSMINAKIEGYPYRIHLNENKSINSLLIPEYYKDSLAAIALLPYGDYEYYQISSFLRSQYGPDSFGIKDTSDKLNRDDDIIFNWLKDGYIISYNKDPFEPILFKSIQLNQAKDKEVRAVDSVVKQINKKAVDATRNDFK